MFFAEVSLTPSSPRRCYNISILDDSILESAEDFLGQLVLLDPVPPQTTLGTSEARVTITDDESELTAINVWMPHFMACFV